ncbi:Hypothetical protein SMAX5B_017447 [Scophthalmus maximus]|uniref:Uncharacterized protein n=1 Tax=Scophthalmus maximus TaxID=52904 RepID=A0A2U9CQ68_SCOMX|nr:Hypothetical protein SMAX5B_017447 [Scophthalmus maximus]
MGGSDSEEWDEKYPDTMQTQPKSHKDKESVSSGRKCPKCCLRTRDCLMSPECGRALQISSVVAWCGMCIRMFVSMRCVQTSRLRPTYGSTAQTEQNDKSPVAFLFEAAVKPRKNSSNRFIIGAQRHNERAHYERGCESNTEVKTHGDERGLSENHV